MKQYVLSIEQNIDCAGNVYIFQVRDIQGKIEKYKQTIASIKVL